MIDLFKGPHFYLSNFHQSPITWRDIDYPTVEHFFQAMKTRNVDEQKKIARCGTPAKAKKKGRSLTLRKDWLEIRDQVMETGLKLKFTVNSHLTDALLSTGEQQLVEGNHWHDNYWGSCTCHNCRNIPDKNKLGIALMNLRAELKQIRLQLT